MRLIDGDELKKALNANCENLCPDKDTNWCEHCCPHNEFEDLIDNAPTVEKPTGEWTTIGEEQGALGIIYKIRRCSKCGWEHSLVIPDNFCPNCGADMRGGNEND